MRRKYTTEQRRIWNQRYYEKKRKLGWVNCTFHVPKNVAAALEKLKQELMAAYKSELALKVVISDKNNGENKLTFYAFNRMEK
jgi:hypothetical protein